MIDVLGVAARRYLPVIRQSEAAECGLACLAMIASYFGRRTNLAALRLRHPVSLKGSTLKSLINIAALLGLDSRPLRLELDALQKLELPCVLHWGMNHFVVLKSVQRKHFIVHDPATGEKHYSLAQMSEQFTGIALELKPASGFQRRDERQTMRLSDLWSRISGLKRVLIQTLILSIVVQLFVIAAPFYMQLVVDDVLTKFDTDLLFVLALGFGLFMLIREMATALRAFVILHISSLLEFQMVSNLFRHLLRLPMQWYEKRHVGDILSRFSSTQPIRDLFAEGLVATVIDGLMAVSTLILMFLYSRTLGMVVVAALVLYVSLRLALYRPFRERSEDQIVSRAQEQSALIESVRGIQSIKTYGREAERQSFWQNKYADAINNTVKLGKLRIGFVFANGLLFGIENTVVIYLGALAVINGSLTIGMLFAFLAYKQQMTGKAVLLVERFIEFRLLGMHLERISDIALSPQEQGLESSDDVSIETRGKIADRGLIELQDVSFRYAESEPWILQEVSLKIRRGEMISFVGPSGCGKSTLMKLLLGLCEPEHGNILFEGVPLVRYGHARYRQKVGTVMQNDVLLSGSIADNISFFDLEPDFEKIQRCAEQAAIHRDIVSMAMGYNSLVGDMGAALSAGQKQRVLLARALYRDPEILILDEGTANLDSATESTIVRMLSKLEITRICVAHRHQMTMASDRIALLNSGTIHELDKQQLLSEQHAGRAVAR